MAILESTMINGNLNVNGKILKNGAEIESGGGITVPTLTFSLSQLVRAQTGTVGSATYLTVKNLTDAQKTILTTESNVLIKIDMSAFSSLIPISYAWIKRNEKQTVTISGSSRTIHQFEFSCSDYDLSHATDSTNPYVVMNKIGDGSAIYDATGSTHYLYLTYLNINIDRKLELKSDATRLHNGTTGAGTLEQEIEEATFTFGNSGSPYSGQTLTTAAVGNFSMVLGGSSRADSAYAFASGQKTYAHGYGSHTEGNNTYAGNEWTHAEGQATNATGLSAHAEGAATKASGNYSHAEGHSTIASGGYSHAEGYDNTASGDFSHAEGYGTTADGDYSHAEGYNTTVHYNAPYGHAEGQYTYAYTACGHAEGKNTSAYYHAHAEGNGTIASGDFSHAAGLGTKASKQSQYVFGAYNSYETGSTSDRGSYIEIVGKGTSSSRSNARTLDWYGNERLAGTYYTYGADYAEFFEWKDENVKNENRLGYLVTLDGNKIVMANATDDIIGITSGSKAVVGDASELNWSGQYVKDDFDQIVYEQQTIHHDAETRHHEAVIDTDNEVLSPAYDEVLREAFDEVVLVPKINPDYDPTQEYIQRSARKEWSPVGLVGKIKARYKGTLAVGDYVTAENGFAVKSAERTNMRVIEINSNSIARIFIK